MDFRLPNLTAEVIGRCEARPSQGPGHPLGATVRVVATLRRFSREGSPRRRLRASVGEVGGSTPRRRPGEWAESGVPAKTQALLVAMLRGRGNPTLVLDGCSVRARRGGDPAGPNPTDRARKGTKRHIAVRGDGIPAARLATAANVGATVMFGRLFLRAFAVVARIRAVSADMGYDAGRHRRLRRNRGVAPRVHKRGRPHGSGPGRRRRPVGRTNAWLWENRRPGLRYDRHGFIVRSPLQEACILLIAKQLAREL